jgi:hypothetical protein
MDRFTEVKIAISGGRGYNNMKGYELKYVDAVELRFNAMYHDNFV